MKKFGLVCGCIFTILLAFWLFTSSKLIYLSFQEPEDIYDYSFDITEHGDGGRIETEIYASLGYCAYETNTTTKNGSVVSSSTTYYYVVPAFDKNDETYYICVEVKQGNTGTYKTITNNTMAYFNGDDSAYGATTVDFSGTINELDDEIYDLMVEWFEDAEIYESDADLKAHVLPLCLTTMNFDASTGYIIANVVLLVLAIISWALFFIGRSKQKARIANAHAQTMAQFPGQNPEDFVVINGVSYPKSSMAHINSYVNNMEKVVAIKELRDITGLELAEAKNVIENWNKYYF